jgi:EAL and modified HD-GYP domain-containing signal transduction protein
MEVFVARQPIFNLEDRVVGYELLHRAGPSNQFAGIDAATATSQLLSDNLLSGDGWHRLTGGRRAWVNFPASLLLDGSATLVPPEHLVVELLEDIVVNDEIVEACKDLAERGYVLAADDVVTPEDTSPLLDLVDIVKVDFRLADGAQRAGLADRFRGQHRLLAEKVETRAERAEAVDLGYGLLQGYFLREPAMVSRRTVNQTRIGALSLMEVVSKSPMDFTEVEDAIKREVALTDKLLRYLNSVSFGWKTRITTIRKALVTLGEVQVRRWVSVAVVSAVAADQPDELMASTLTRARLCELLSAAPGIDAEPFELFLTGMYSQMHVLIDAEPEAMLADAPLPETVRGALLDQTGPLWTALKLAVCWEAGDWDGVGAFADALGLRLDDLPKYYARALAFADTIRADDASSRVAV